MINGTRAHNWVDETQPEQRDAGNVYMRCSRCSLYVRRELVAITTVSLLEASVIHVEVFSRIVDTGDGVVYLSPVHPTESRVCNG